MAAKTILITGSTDGIGKQAALELATAGHKVIIHGRQEARCQATADWISRQSRSRVEWVVGDFSSLQQVRQMAGEINRRFQHLNVLVNNAGVYEPQRRLSEDGYEMTFAVNHLAHFLLTGLLLNLLFDHSPARIVTVSSMAHASHLDFDNLQGETSYSGYGAYALSKLANILFTFELARRLEGKPVQANCLHPGVISTKLLHAGWGVGGADVSQGAQMLVYLATSSEVENISGQYFSDYRITEPAPVARNEQAAKKLWQISEQLTGFRYPI